jgi:1,4-alpha-glucan branching enzyme
MNSVKTYTLFTDHDVYLFKEGRHYKLYGKFGAHSAEKMA